MKRKNLKGLLFLPLLFCFGQLFAQQQNNSINNEIRQGDAAKEQLIKEHPEEYRQQGGQVEASVPEFKTQEEKDAWVESQEPDKTSAVSVQESEDNSAMDNSKGDPTFPKFIDTGDPEKDAADYQARKDAWYAERQPEKN